MSIIDIRHNYRAAIKLAHESDSKKETLSLVAMAKEELTQLRLECPHEHIVELSPAYEGSYSYDYDDWRVAHLICLMCGLEEYGPKVLVKTPMYRCAGQLPLELREPLKFLLSEAVSAAEEHGRP